MSNNSDVVMLKTFDEWNKDGYRIKKGSKAAEFVDGKAMFSDDQVYVPRTRYVTSPDDYDMGYLEDDPMNYDLGICGQH